MTHLSTAPLDAAAIAASVTGAATGATVTFVGTVRDHHRGRGVVGLEYSAYGPMAEQVIARVARDVGLRHGAVVAIVHRLGTLAVGDAAVVVVAASAHRDAAFAAAREAIDEVKRLAPIWKRETYADGSVDWVDPTAGTADA